MQSEVRREVKDDRVLLVGTTGPELTEVFSVAVRTHPTTMGWVGYNAYDGPVVEIEWLEVKKPFRSVGAVRRVVCYALREALAAAEGVTMLIGISPELPSLRRRLTSRDDFEAIDEAPFPFVAGTSTIVELRDRVCRGYAEIDAHG